MASSITGNFGILTGSRGMEGLANADAKAEQQSTNYKLGGDRPELIKLSQG
jgi:hypothetical protein